MMRALRVIGTTVLALVVAGGMAITIVPRFLDRIYYEGPASDHFDGARFFNPDGDDDTLGHYHGLHSGENYVESSVFTSSLAITKLRKHINILQPEMEFNMFLRCSCTTQF